MRWTPLDMSDQLLGSELPIQPAADNLGVEPGYGLGHFIYLAAIATATIGWLGLIAWVATASLNR